MRKWFLLSNTHKIVVAIVLLGCLCACTKKTLVVGARQVVLPDEIGQTFTCRATAIGSLAGTVDGNDRFLTPVDATFVVAADVSSVVVAVKRIAGAASVSIASQWQSQSVPSHEIAVRFIHAGNYTLEFELANVSGKRAVCSWQGALSANTISPESAPVIRSITPVPAIVSSGSPVTVTVVAQGNISEIRVGGVVLPQGASSLSLANTQSGRRVVPVTVTGPGGVASGETNYLVNPTCALAPAAAGPYVAGISFSLYLTVNGGGQAATLSGGGVTNQTVAMNAPFDFTPILVGTQVLTAQVAGPDASQASCQVTVSVQSPEPLVYQATYTGATMGPGHAIDMVISPDGNYVHVASATSNTIKTYSRNALDGALTSCRDSASPYPNGTIGPLTLDPVGDNVYAVFYDPNRFSGGSNDAMVSVFRRDSTLNRLTHRYDVNGASSPTDLSAIAVSSDGLSVYTLDKASNGLHQFSFSSTNPDYPPSLRFIVTSLERPGLFAHSSPGFQNPQSIALSPDGRHAYVASTDNHAVLVYGRSLTSGALQFMSFVGSAISPQFIGPSVVTVSRDGKNVYVGSQTSDAIYVFSRDPASGALSLVEALMNNSAGIAGLINPNKIVEAPDGAYIYVNSQGSTAPPSCGGGVLVFRRNPTNGTLTFVSSVDRIACPTALAVSPDGRSLYIGSSTNEIASYQRR